MGSPVEDQSWHESAVCRQVDPELWFPETGGDNGAAAKAVCSNCPVRVECEEYAITAFETYGVWGGKTPRELANLRARRGLAAAPIAPAAAEGVMVSAVGVVRRRQALACMGYGLPEVAEALGVSTSTASSHLGHAAVRATTRDRWQEIYSRLSTVEGPNGKARRCALRAGWLPPSAWDESTIDDPATQPLLVDGVAA